MIRGFVCPTEHLRDSWLHDALLRDFKLGMNAVVLFRDPRDVSAVPQRKYEMCIAGHGVFPGGRLCDPALEILLSSESIETAAARFSAMVLADGEKASAAESLTRRSGRIVLSSLFEAAVGSWSALQEDTSSGTDIPSLTAMLFSIVSDLSESQASRPWEGSGGCGIGDVKESEWREYLPEADRTSLFEFFADNAPQTVRRIFSELGRSCATFSGIVSDKKVVPYCTVSRISGKTTFFVHAPTIGWFGLSSILEICRSWGNFLLVIPDVSAFSSADASALERIIERAMTFPDTANIIWAASREKVGPAFLRGDVTFDPGTRDGESSVLEATDPGTSGNIPGAALSYPQRMLESLPGDGYISRENGKRHCEELQRISTSLCDRRDMFGNPE